MKFNPDRVKRQHMHKYLCLVWKRINLPALRKRRGRWAENRGRIQRNKFMNNS